MMNMHNPNRFPRILGLFAVALIGLLFANACTLLNVWAKPGTGNVAITVVNESASRTIAPTAPTIASYMVRLSRTGSVDVLGYSTTSTITASSVPTGTWNLVVEAYLNTGSVATPPTQLLGRSNVVKIDVAAGSTPSTQTVSFAPTENGTGTLNVTFNWTTIDADFSSLSLARLSDNKDITLASGVTNAAGTASMNLSGIRSAISDPYIVKLRLKKNGVDMAPFDEIAYVCDNQTSSKTITIASADLDSAPSAPTGLTASITAGSNTTINLSWTKSAVNAANYIAYVGGTARDSTLAGNASSYSVTSSTTDTSFAVASKNAFGTSSQATLTMVRVTGIGLSSSSATIGVGGTAKPMATLTTLSSTATITTVDWSSNDATKATVDSTGLITAVAAGPATITAKARDGGTTATFAATVVSTGNIKGQVALPDASALAGVTVSATAGVAIYSTTTAADGSFTLAVPAGTWTVSFSKSTYNSTSYPDISVTAGANTVIESVMTWLSSASGNAGISGTIFDASTSGAKVGGATINFRAGINTTTGTIVKTATSSSTAGTTLGTYSWDGRNSSSVYSPGAYTAEVIKTGYVTLYFTVNVVPGSSTRSGQDTTMSQTISTGNVTRFVLTWNSSPADLDIKAMFPSGATTKTFPDGYAGYSAAPFGSVADVNSDYAKIESDCTTGSGPEAVSIGQHSGIYGTTGKTITIAALNYSHWDWFYDASNGAASPKNGTEPIAMKASGAKLTVYRSNSAGTTTTLIGTFYVPAITSGTTNNDTWNICTMDTSGTLVLVGTITDSGAYVP
jgi:hypothetical protein